ATTPILSAGPGPATTNTYMRFNHTQLVDDFDRVTAALVRQRSSNNVTVPSGPMRIRPLLV
ncbi:MULTISPECIES: hypothetical protein, partial [Rhodococcus erythropolis group]|uniref:hypothetical protein n=1 Tax=Rhodococcus erythropolis group TaxID=2840174 RepID=UPI001E3F0B6B